LPIVPYHSSTSQGAGLLSRGRAVAGQHVTRREDPRRVGRRVLGRNVQGKDGQKITEKRIGYWRANRRVSDNPGLVMTALLSPTLRIFSHVPVQNLFAQVFPMRPSDCLTSEGEFNRIRCQKRPRENVGSPSFCHGPTLSSLPNQDRHPIIHNFCILRYGFTCTSTRYTSLNSDH
jgi:hypothetical protein